MSFWYTDRLNCRFWAYLEESNKAFVISEERLRMAYHAWKQQNKAVDCNETYLFLCWQWDAILFYFLLFYIFMANRGWIHFLWIFCIILCLNLNIWYFYFSHFSTVYLGLFKLENNLCLNIFWGVFMVTNRISQWWLFMVTNWIN